MVTMEIYFKNGNIYRYKVANAEKAREHADKIWTTGYRVDTSTEDNEEHTWYGPHYLDKIKWTGKDTTNK